MYALPVFFRSLDELERDLLDRPPAFTKLDAHLRAQLPLGIATGALVTRGGTRLHRGLADVVPLGDGELFGLPLAELRAEITPRLDDVPPGSFAGTFSHERDLRANHRRAARAIAEFLDTDAPPTPSQNAPHLHQAFRSGPFEITVVTFPDRTDQDDTTVRVSLATPFLDPDPSLSCILHTTRTSLPRTRRLGRGARFANRVHPDAVRAAIGPTEYSAWRQGPRAGVGNRVISVTFEVGCPLTLVRRHPARGGGGSLLEVTLDGQSATLFEDDSPTGLDDLTRELAAFFGATTSAVDVDDD